MTSTTGIFELQIDEKLNSFTIRLNDETGCVLRISQIPKELIRISILKEEIIDLNFKNK